MIKCKDCKQDITFDYMFNNDVCLDCADYDMEMAWQKYEQDCEDQDVSIS